MNHHLVALIALTAAAFAQQDRALQPQNRRLALIIGNNQYPQNALRNAVNDARSMADTLRPLGFQTTLLTDAGLKSTEAAVDGFIKDLKPGDTALFYYAGHGIQVDGENYLVPTDFAATDATDVKYRAYAAGQLLGKMEGARTRLNIMILDACRDNPFRGFRSGTRGLAGMSSGRGSLVAFATAPGQTAADSPAAVNGLFTQHLIEALKKPSIGISSLFDGVREQVDRASNGKQVPWTSSGVVGDFVFNDPSARRAEVQAEIARLEAEIERQRRTALSADAARQQAEREAKLRQEKADLERLNQEAVRQRELQAERDRLAALEAIRERERKEEEARLDELRRKSREQKPTEGMTLEQARAEVARLRAGIKAKAEERDKALERVDADYRPLREAAARSMVKGEFETTAEFRARLKQQESPHVAENYAAARKQIEGQHLEEESAENAKIQAIMELSFGTPCLVEWAGYDADERQLALRVSGRNVRLQVDPTIARELKPRIEQLACETRYTESTQPNQPLLGIYDHATNKRFSFIQRKGKSGDTETNSIDGLLYVWIPRGIRTAEYPGGTGGFWMGQTEVTQRAWKRVMDGQNPSVFIGDELPVDNINWHNAQQFCKAAGMRLPTEAEWEYSASAGSSTSSYGTVDAIAWHNLNAGGKTHRVGGKQWNPYKLYDMLGNVHEWVETETSSDRRIVRGGSWFDAPSASQISFRLEFGASSAYNNFGVRCAGDTLP